MEKIIVRLRVLQFQEISLNIFAMEIQMILMYTKMSHSNGKRAKSFHEFKYLHTTLDSCQSFNLSNNKGLRLISKDE